MANGRAMKGWLQKTYCNLYAYSDINGIIYYYFLIFFKAYTNYENYFYQVNSS